MQEICFCGRSGDIEDREPVSLEDGGQALRCPECGHIERATWLSDWLRTEVFEEAVERKARRGSPSAA